MKTIEQRISILEKKVGFKEAGGDYGFKNYDYEVGDTVGNTVQGFDFKVLKFLPNEVVLVKDTKTGKQQKIYKQSIYLPNTRVKESKRSVKESNTENDYSYVLSQLQDEGLSYNNISDFHELASQRDKEQLASYAEKFNNAEDYNDSTGGRFQRQVITPALSIVRRVVGYR